jgi:uncharacterized protein (DUF2147 family)
MNKFCYFILYFISIAAFSQSHTVIGKWKTLDDETGRPVSVVEIFEKNKKIYGKVIEIFNPKTKVPRCEKCDGEDKNKPILGLIVIKGLTKDGNEYNNGKILDPKHGKIYKCFITLESKDVLKVRGFIGISLIGRTQFWERIK